MRDAPPRVWDEDGAAALGTWRGEIEQLSYEDWDGLDRIKREKRWQWCGAFSDEVAVGLALVRTGYAANVFLWVFDRVGGEFREDVSRVLPPPAVSVTDWPETRGEVARYRGLFENLTITRVDDHWTIAGKVADVRLDLEIIEQASPITAICPVATPDDDESPSINVTRKQAVARSAGHVRVGERRFSLGGTGFLDFSHGILARETIWQWAIGSGTTASGATVGFNLVAGFNDSLENVVWIDGEPREVGEATFDQGETTWRVIAEGVELELQFEAIREQNLDLGLVVSQYQQPLGRWTGTVDGEAFQGVGVAEYHRSVW